MLTSISKRLSCPEFPAWRQNGLPTPYWRGVAWPQRPRYLTARRSAFAAILPE